MKATVNWKRRMSFAGMADSGFQVDLGSEPEVGGDNDGFRPMELIATGLAGCTAMDVISILAKKRQEVTAFEVRVDAQRATEHPKVFTGAAIEYLVTGHNVDEAAVLRAIQLSAERYCPAQAMFAGVFPMTLHYKIFEAQETGAKLAHEGVYTPVEK